MLLRLRVALPDRPGTLGHVARALGGVGADIVAVLVLERAAGRAVDDFTVVWPASSPVDKVVAALTAVSGVRVDGVWRGTELPEPSGREVAVIGQIATNPEIGLSTLVDAVPAILGADWAQALTVGAGWASGGLDARRDSTVVSASWQAPTVPPKADIAPLRPRAVTASDGTHLAVAPFQRNGLVLVVGRGGPEGDHGAPPFHRGEVERLAQIVGTVAAVLGARLGATAGIAEAVVASSGIGVR